VNLGSNFFKMADCPWTGTKALNSVCRFHKSTLAELSTAFSVFCAGRFGVVAQPFTAGRIQRNALLILLVLWMMFLFCLIV